MLLGTCWTQEAVTKKHSIQRVSPKEWRAQVLMEKENQSGFFAKAAFRLIAQQIVEDYGRMGQHNGKFSTYVVESVVVVMDCSTLHGSLDGWIGILVPFHGTQTGMWLS